MTTRRSPNLVHRQSLTLVQSFYFLACRLCARFASLSLSLSLFSLSSFSSQCLRNQTARSSTSSRSRLSASFVVEPNTACTGRATMTSLGNTRPRSNTLRRSRTICEPRRSELSRSASHEWTRALFNTGCRTLRVTTSGSLPASSKAPRHSKPSAHCRSRPHSI